MADDFLKNVRSKFNPRENYVVIKCSFLIENLQPGPVEIDSPIVNMQYSSTEPCRTKHFNDYVFFILKENILKRVIANSMSGSSWRFHRLAYVNLKVLEEVTSLMR